jgi:hypothetical protein
MRVAPAGLVDPVGLLQAEDPVAVAADSALAA